MTEHFASRRRGEWERLESLIASSRKRRVGALSADEIMEMGYLYRRASADLSVARRDFPNDRLTLYLNQLVARAHGVVYRSEAGEWRRVSSFFRDGFPALFREMLPFTIAAFLVFALAAGAAFAVVVVVPETAAYLVPKEIVSSVKENRMWTENIGVPPQVLSSVVMTNNIQVAVFALAGGVLFGVATFYVMASNGLMLGAVAGFCQVYGRSLPLWSFIAPHGFIELTVIFIAGGAGLRLGYALLKPGLQSRREALLLEARKVVKLLFGCAPLLILAGIIEGFVSPSLLLPAAKISIGLATGILLYSYLFLPGRTKGARGPISLTSGVRVS